MISGHVFAFVDGKDEHNQYILFNTGHKAIAMFAQFDFVAPVQVTMQFHARGMGLVEAFF